MNRTPLERTHRYKHIVGMLSRDVLNLFACPALTRHSMQAKAKRRREMETALVCECAVNKAGFRVAVSLTLRLARNDGDLE